MGKLRIVRTGPFESEFDPSDLPRVEGQPLGNSKLLALTDALPASQRIEMARQVIILEAVRSYYFAKAFRIAVLRLPQPLPDSVAPTVKVLCTDLMRLALVNVASVNDQLDRTQSLPNTIRMMKSALAESTEPNAPAAIELLDDIGRRINPETQIPLKYLRHMRNKWAGHASMDRQVDDWAGADTSLSLPLIEEALARLVNAHQDVGEVIEMSDEAKKVVAPARAEPSIVNGVRYFPMTFSWSSVVSSAELVRVAARRSAERLVERLSEDGLSE